mgnify:CR=1 FL=1|tara:strand:+ start:937 stop:1533 length:597 start_codon:yes stop_codon:yes gene_type:complete
MRNFNNQDGHLSAWEQVEDKTAFVEELLLADKKQGRALVLGKMGDLLLFPHVTIHDSALEQVDTILDTLKAKMRENRSLALEVCEELLTSLAYYNNYGGWDNDGVPSYIASLSRDFSTWGFLFNLGRQCRNQGRVLKYLEDGYSPVWYTYGLEGRETRVPFFHAMNGAMIYCGPSPDANWETWVPDDHAPAYFWSSHT